MGKCTRAGQTLEGLIGSTLWAKSVITSNFLEKWRLFGYYWNVLNVRLPAPFLILIIVVVQSLSESDALRPAWTAAHQASPPFSVSWSLVRLTSIESVMPFNGLILCPSPSPAFLQSFPASGSFPVSQLLASGGQSTEAEASVSVLQMNTQG